MTSYIKEESSFRDQAGFVFYRNGDVYRALSESYKNDFELFVESGLKDVLLKENLLVPFTEQSVDADLPSYMYKVLHPQKISNIIYPYEWCFSQLKDAALVTLDIQLHALEKNMTLKDASAFNIMFHHNKPVLIDITSFEAYTEGRPWVAYKQFCQHFIGPLLLMKYTDAECNTLIKNYIDGVPVELTSRLLPRRTHYNINILSHIHWHASSQRKHQGNARSLKHLKMSRRNQVLLLQNLRRFIQNLNLKKTFTQWGAYYEETNYTSEAMRLKKVLIGEFAQTIKASKVVDFGANDGTFSRIFSSLNIPVLALDIDPVAVEKNYRQIKETNDLFLIPLRADITNPSPAIGWNNKERQSLLSRLGCDVGMALALIHHLFFTNNLSFDQTASFFSGLCQYLIIEFVATDDSQVQRMIVNREDTFDMYNEEAFELAYTRYFETLRKEYLPETKRVLYFFMKKNLQ